LGPIPSPLRSERLKVLGPFHGRHGLLLLLFEESAGGLVVGLQVIQLLDGYGGGVRARDKQRPMGTTWGPLMVLLG